MVRKMPETKPGKAGKGNAPVTGTIECGLVQTESRRTAESTSAGFCAAIRSSVMEIAGKRMRMTTANATNWVRRSLADRGATRSHAHTIHTATNAQPRLSVSSIPSANST